MPAINQSLYEEAYLAFQEGNASGARDILTRLIKSEPDNYSYWLLMSGVVETEKERLFCLQEVLRLDPGNSTARQGMVILGKIPPQADLIVPISEQQVNWKIAPIEPPALPKIKKRVKPVRIILPIGAVILVGSIAAILIINSDTNPTNNRIVLRSPLFTMGPSPTYLPKNTLLYETPVTGKDGPPPLSSLLEFTYTPTPLYVQTPHPRSEAYRVALSKMVSQNYESAISYFQQAANLEQDSADIQYYLGEAYRLNKNAENARKAYLEALNIAPDFAPAYLGLGLLKAQSSAPDYKAAQDYFLKALENDANLVEARLAYVEVSLQNKEVPTALEMLEPLQNTASISPRYHYLLGYASYLNGDMDTAMQELEISYQLDITNLEVYRLLGEIYVQQELYSDAIGMLETVLRYEPDNGDALAWLGMAHYEVGEYDKALEILNKAISRNTRNPTLYAIRGQIFFKEDELKKAIDDFNVSLKLEKDQFETHLALSLAYLANEQPGNAYLQLSTAEAYYINDTQHAQMLYYRAQSLELLNEISPAMKDWKALLALPDESMPAEWKTYAQSRLAALFTPTRTQVTVTASMTRMPTLTSTITITRLPTLTQTVTLTKLPTRTFTVTPTPKPNMTLTPTPTNP